MMKTLAFACSSSNNLIVLIFVYQFFFFLFSSHSLYIYIFSDIGVIIKKKKMMNKFHVLLRTEDNQKKYSILLIIHFKIFAFIISTNNRCIFNNVNKIKSITNKIRVYHQILILIQEYQELLRNLDDIFLIINHNKKILIDLDLIEYLMKFLTIDNPNKFHIYL